MSHTHNASSYRVCVCDVLVSLHSYTEWSKSLWAPDVTSNVQSVLRQSDYLAESDCFGSRSPGPGDARRTLTPSVFPVFNDVTMVSEWNCLKYFCVCLYCNHQVHGVFFITLYKTTYFREISWTSFGDSYTVVLANYGTKLDLYEWA
jgi:hypothetical protein